MKTKYSKYRFSNDKGEVLYDAECKTVFYLVYKDGLCDKSIPIEILAIMHYTIDALIEP
jgi:hypothetical protein